MRARATTAKSVMIVVGVSAAALVSTLVLPAGASGGSVVGAWTTKVSNSQHGMLTVRMHFSPNATFTMSESYEDKATHKPHTLLNAVGTYKLTTHKTAKTPANSSLTMMMTRIVADGRPQPSAAGGSALTGTTAFSDGGRTLTLTYPHYKQVLARE